MSGGDAMLAAAAAKGTLLTINHNRRWENSMRKLQAAVKAGTLGTLHSAEVVWPSGRAGVVGTHFIDAMLMVVQQRAISVSGMIDDSPFVDCRNNADNADFMAIQGETNIHDPGCYGTIKMDGGLIVTVCAGNNLSGGAAIRLYGSAGQAEIGRGVITVKLFGKVSSVGQIVGEPSTEVSPLPTILPRTPTRAASSLTAPLLHAVHPRGVAQVWEEEGSDGLNTCERCVREIVATLDGTAPFPYDPREGVHACEILLGVMASHKKNGAFVSIPMGPEDYEVAARWA